MKVLFNLVASGFPWLPYCFVDERLWSVGLQSYIGCSAFCRGFKTGIDSSYSYSTNFPPYVYSLFGALIATSCSSRRCSSYRRAPINTCNCVKNSNCIVLQWQNCTDCCHAWAICSPQFLAYHWSLVVDKCPGAEAVWRNVTVKRSFAAKELTTLVGL